MKNKRLFISLVFNFCIFAIVLAVSIILLKKSPSSIKYFTTQSNIFAGITSLVMLIFEILYLVKKTNKIPKWVSIFKMISTVGVVLTFMVVAFYLNFVAVSQGYSYFRLYQGTDFFFHFLVPVLAAISFMFFEGRKDIKFRYTFVNLIHLLGYIIFYAINVLTHLQNGKAIRKYDWYYFATGDLWLMFPVGLLILLLGYGFGFGLWIINKKFAKVDNYDL